MRRDPGLPVGPPPDDGESGWTDFVHTDSVLGHHRVVSSALFCILCTPMTTNHVVKFDDDAAVVGLISGSDEIDYREKVTSP